MLKKKLLFLAASSGLVLALVSCSPASTPAGSTSADVSSSEGTSSGQTGGDTSSETSSEMTLTFAQAAQKALTNRDLVSEQSETHVFYDETVTVSFYTGSDAYGALALMLTQNSDSGEVSVWKHLSNEKLIALDSYDEGEHWSSGIAEEKYLKGTEYDFGTELFGAEEVLAAIASDAKMTTVDPDSGYTYRAKAFKETVDDDGAFTSSLVEADAEFNLGTNGAMKNAKIILTEYYNYETKEDGTYEVVEAEGSSIEYTVTNTCAQKITSLGYDVEKYYATAWTAEDEDGNKITAATTIEAEAGGEDLVFTFDEVAPTTAALYVDSPDCKVFQNGEECDVYANPVYEYDDDYEYYTGFQELDLSYSELEAGDYDIVLSTALVSLSFKLTVTPASPKTFTFANYTCDQGVYTERETQTEVEDEGTFSGSTFVGVPLYIVASTEPSAAGGSVVATSSSGNVRIETATFTDEWYNEQNAIKVTATEVGDYTLTMKNSAYPDGISATYNLSVTAAPSLGDVVAKKYIVAKDSFGVGYELSFDATANEVTIVDHVDDYDSSAYAYVTHTNTYTYTYNAETGLFALELKSGDDKESTTWPVPTLGLSSKMLPMIQYAEYSDWYEFVEDTPKARLIGSTFKYGDTETQVEEGKPAAVYELSFKEGGADLVFDDLTNATWYYDEDYEEYYYKGYDYYKFVSDDYSLTETENGYTVSAIWDQDDSSTGETLTQDEIFSTITVAKNYQTVTIINGATDPVTFTLTLSE